VKAGAITCDTGGLIDYLVASAPDHRAFRAAIDDARARYVPGLVLAEVDYFLRRERAAMRALILRARAVLERRRRERRDLVPAGPDRQLSRPRDRAPAP